LPYSSIPKIVIVDIFAMSRAAGGNQPSRLLSVVEKMPALGDRGVQLEKVAQSGAITSANGFFGDEMPSERFAPVTAAK